MVNLSKIPSTPAGEELKRHAVVLQKHCIKLTKETGINFSSHKAQVAMAIDRSGSMSYLYSSGKVQETLNRILPLALQFDDNGELEVWQFNNGSNSCDAMTLSNYENYVRKCMNGASGGTNYAPVLKDIKKHYFGGGGFFGGGNKNKSKDPVFLFFVTDGENFDESETDRIIRDLSNDNIFIQFVGIGDERFKYLQHLDDLSGRACDNTGFIKVEDFSGLSDEELYQLLLSQYPEWLKARGN